MLVTFIMGFACGLPLLLTISLLQAWMKEEGVDLAMIGMISLVGLPYTVKFLWAPFLDRYIPPFWEEEGDGLSSPRYFLFCRLQGLHSPTRA